MNPWLLLAGLLSLLGVGAGSAYLTHNYDTGQEARALVAAEAHVTTVVQRQAGVTLTVAMTAQAEHDRIVYRTQTLIKDVPTYVDQKADAGCTVTDGFVSLWNTSPGDPAAATGPAQPDDRPSGVALSGVARAVAAAHGAFDANAAQLTELQGWLRQQGLAPPP